MNTESLLSRAIALTIKAFDLSRSVEEREEYTLAALMILAKLSRSTD